MSFVNVTGPAAALRCDKDQRADDPARPGECSQAGLRHFRVSSSYHNSWRPVVGAMSSSSAAWPLATLVRSPAAGRHFRGRARLPAAHVWLLRRSPFFYGPARRRPRLRRMGAAHRRPVSGSAAMCSTRRRSIHISLACSTRLLGRSLLSCGWSRRLSASVSCALLGLAATRFFSPRSGPSSPDDRWRSTRRPSSSTALIQKSVLDLFFLSSRAVADCRGSPMHRGPPRRGWRSAPRWAV